MSMRNSSRTYWIRKKIRISKKRCRVAPRFESCAPTRMRRKHKPWQSRSSTLKRRQPKGLKQARLKALSRRRWPITFAAKRSSSTTNSDGPNPPNRTDKHRTSGPLRRAFFSPLILEFDEKLLSFHRTFPSDQNYPTAHPYSRKSVAPIEPCQFGCVATNTEGRNSL